MNNEAGKPRFYVWFDGGVQAAWRTVLVVNSLDCTDMGDEEFGRAVDSLLSDSVAFTVRKSATCQDRAVYGCGGDPIDDDLADSLAGQNDRSNTR